MKKLILSTALFTIASGVFSQEVNYTKIYDDPDNVAPLKITIDPLWMDLWGVDFLNAGVGARMEYTYKKIANINTNARIELNNKYLEVIGSFHLKDNTSASSLPVVLSSSSDGTYTTSKYINVPAHKRKILSIRGGFFKTDATLDLHTDGLYKTPFTAINNLGESATFEFGNPGQPGSYDEFKMNLFTLSAGISYKTITNLKIETSVNKRSKKNRKVNDVYFDVLFNGKTSFGDLISENKTVWHMNNENIKKIGWRTGFVMNRGAFSYKVEVASRPGVKGGNLSLLQVLGFTIPVKLGTKAGLL